MPRKFFTQVVSIPIAATGTQFNYTVPDTLRCRLIQMILVTPDYTTASPTTTISLIDKNNMTFWTDGTPRAEASVIIIAMGGVILEPGDTIRATLSDVAGGATTVYLTLHAEE